MLLNARVVAKNRLTFHCFACNVERFKPGLNIHVQHHLFKSRKVRDSTRTTHTNRKTMITMYFSQYNHAHTSICSKVFLWLGMHVIKIVSPKNNLLWSKFNLGVGLQHWAKVESFRVHRRGSVRQKGLYQQWETETSQMVVFLQWSQWICPEHKGAKKWIFFQLVTIFFCGCLLRVILCYLYVPVEETRGVVFKIFLFA